MTVLFIATKPGKNEIFLSTDSKDFVSPVTTEPIVAIRKENTFNLYEHTIFNIRMIEVADEEKFSQELSLRKWGWDDKDKKLVATDERLWKEELQETIFDSEEK